MTQARLIVSLPIRDIISPTNGSSWWELENKRPKCLPEISLSDRRPEVWRAEPGKSDSQFRLNDLTSSLAISAKDMGHLSIYDLAIVLFVVSESFIYTFNASIIGRHGPAFVLWVFRTPWDRQWNLQQSWHVWWSETVLLVGFLAFADNVIAMNSAFAAGGLVVSLCTSSFDDRLGRKRFRFLKSPVFLRLSSQHSFIYVDNHLEGASTVGLWQSTTMRPPNSNNPPFDGTYHTF